MRLGMMQPYFFPYLQQFRHIAQCDLWIVFDTVQFARKTWVTRNRVLSRESGWAYVSAAVKRGETGVPLDEARLSDDPWRKAIEGRLRAYRGHAPFYDETMSLVREVIDSPAPTVGELNYVGLRTLCDALDIGTPLHRLSGLDVDLPATLPAGEWALWASKALGARTYSNAPGGQHLFDPSQFRAAGIGLEFYEPVPLRYSTGPFDFQADLSIIDSLMWIGTGSARDFVRREPSP